MLLLSYCMDTLKEVVKKLIPGKRTVNRYDPNRPDWTAVHKPDLIADLEKQVVELEQRVKDLEG